MFEYFKWIEVAAPAHHLEVQVAACGEARGSDISDDLSSAHTVPTAHGVTGEVHIARDPAIVVTDGHHLACTTASATRDHSTVGDGVEASSTGRGEVHTPMHAASS